jgi:hypothetical protein
MVSRNPVRTYPFLQKFNVLIGTIGFVEVIKGQGMPIFQHSHHGDLFVEYNVVLPTKLSPQIKKRESPAAIQATVAYISSYQSCRRSSTTRTGSQAGMNYNQLYHLRRFSRIYINPRYPFESASVACFIGVQLRAAHR